VAFKDCRGLSNHDPIFAKAFSERGSENVELGEYRKAIQDYDKAIHLSANLELYNDRGLAYQASGDFDQALEDFQDAIGRNPGFPPAYYNIGKLLYELGEYAFAVRDYSSAILIDPSYADAYVDRALAYTILEKDKAAEFDIERAVELGIERVELEAAIQELKNQR
jgi:tetratricopeptide (TPR) repeat protein